MAVREAGGSSHSCPLSSASFDTLALPSVNLYLSSFFQEAFL